MHTNPGLIASIILGFGPMFLFAYIIYWLDRYEKEPKHLLGFGFLWGAVLTAAFAFMLNTLLGMGTYLIIGSELFTELATGSLFAPIIEESLKGLGVFVVFLLFRNEFDSIVDGIVYAAIIALGFAAVENSYYIYALGYLENGWEGLVSLAFVRIALVGWQHPFYTSFIGIGIGVTRVSRNTALKVLAPSIGWLIAVGSHSLHNTLASFVSDEFGFIATTLLDWSGWLVMLLFIIWALNREQNYIVEELREEVDLGTMTIQHYRTASSARAQSLARWSAFFSGKYHTTARFYQLTGELAHKKRQFAVHGDENGNGKIIEALRDELSRLALLI